MRVLIVGAGAVGQVYGYHLQRGGVEVGFLVRPRYADEARGGLTLYLLNARDRSAPVAFTGFSVHTSAAEAAAAGPWDQVMLAVSTPAIQGAWLDELVAAVPDATYVSLQPGPEGQGRMSALVPAERLIFGVIAFIAYQAPLPNETRFPRPGIAVWFPPGPSPFAGPEAPTRALVDALRAGACPARVVPDLTRGSSFGAGLLQAHIAALESAGWTWDAVRRDGWLQLASAAWREIAAIAAHDLGSRPPWWAGLIRPIGARLALWATPWLIPIDMETYLAYHFTKVGDQTRSHLEHWVARGRLASLSTAAIETLRERMDHGPVHVGAEAARAH